MLNLINVKKLKKSKFFASSLISVSFIGLLTSTTPASEPTPEASATIEPSSFTKEERVAQTVELERTVTLDLSELSQTIETPGESVIPEKLDVLFLADNTYTMQAPINDVIANASELLTTLNNTYGAAAGGDMQVGVAFYRGDPTEYGNPGEIFKLSEKPNKPDGSSYTLGVGAVPETYNIDYTFVESYYNSWGRLRYKYKKSITNSTGELISEEIIISRNYYTNSQLAGFSGSFSGAPVEHQAYQLLEAVDGGTIADAEAAISQWYSQAESDNNQYPEGNFFALHQAATSGAEISGYSTGYDTNWRADSDKRIIIIFGDAEAITSAVSLTETINALSNNNITVVAINVQDNGTPTWAEFNSDQQFYSTDENTTTITSATNGTYANSYSNEIASTMLNLIGTVAMVDTSTTTTVYPKVDINFSTIEDPLVPLATFVDDQCSDPVGCVKYECIDDLGCDQVSHDESRKFKMIFQGNIPEDYIFDTVAVDGSGNNITGAISNNDITIHSID